MTRLPRPGEDYYVGAACGVPHKFRPIYFRLVKVDHRPGWDGMLWLHGYELDAKGDASELRDIYVIADGLRHVTLVKRSGRDVFGVTRGITADMVAPSRRHRRPTRGAAA